MSPIKFAVLLNHFFLVNQLINSINFSEPKRCISYEMVDICLEMSLGDSGN